MDRPHGKAHYTTVFVRDDIEGWAAVDLYCVSRGTKVLQARVRFWDAVGQLVLETSAVEIPLTIVEELIAEAKEFIKTS